MNFYENENITLKSFTERELNDFKYQSWFYDPDVTKYNSHGLFPYTKAKQESFMKSIENNERIVFAIYVKIKSENGCLLQTLPDPPKFIKTWEYQELYIGNISLQSINWIYRSAEIAWVIGEKDYWGKGIATEAGKLMLYHAFNRLNLHRIWAGTASTNIAMQKVFSKLNFQQEGIFTDGMFLRGRYVDIWNYFILNTQMYDSQNFERKEEHE